MINIDRDENIPESLNTPEIREYLDLVIQHINDPENNQKPEKPASYRNSDLLEAFDNCFHSKCYLTEEKFKNSWVMDIEHFIGQNERPDLIYEWTNLFPADHYSNMIKPRRTPEGGYLNPCDPGDDVETEIIYSLSLHGFDPNFETRDVNNIKANNTANLLDRIHNGHDINTKNGTQNLRHAIHKKYVDILNKIIEYQNSPDDSQQKYQVKRELKDLVSKKSSYTMLCRSIPALNFVEENLFD